MLLSPLEKFLATIKPVACRQLCERSNGGAVMLTSRTKKLIANKTNSPFLQFIETKMQKLGTASGRCEHIRIKKNPLLQTLQVKNQHPPNQIRSVRDHNRTVECIASARVPC